ncbi:MAG: DHHA1 domain-containing protein [Polyangiaceae bacterium]
MASLDPTNLRSAQVVVAHADCPDGIASALLLHAALPEAEVRFVEHGTPEHRDLAAVAGMVFCDIVPPAARAAEFVAAGAVVLDHHRSARDVIAAFGPRGVFADEDDERGVSGALLAYREVWVPLLGESAPARRFAELAGIRDCWLTEHPDWREATNQAAALLLWGYPELATGPGVPPSLSEAQAAAGARAVTRRADTARQIAARELLFATPRLAIYNDRERSVSDVAQAAFELHPELAVVAGFYFKVTSEGRMLLVCSLRSRPLGVDVAAIAKRLGGGGHRAAAGFGREVTTDMPNPLTLLTGLLSPNLSEAGGAQPGPR